MNATFTVHGFNVDDGGADTVCRLKPVLRKYDQGHILNHQYRRLGLIGVLLNNTRIARGLMHRALSMESKGNRVNAIGHSNGCAIIVEAARQGANFDSVILINPALNINIKFPLSIKHILVVYTKHDGPTRLARFLDAMPLVGKLIPDIWGAMGAVGYKGTDTRVNNLNLSYSVEGHSDIFESHNLAEHGPTLAKWIYGV